MPNWTRSLFVGLVALGLSSQAAWAKPLPQSPAALATPLAVAWVPTAEGPWSLAQASPAEAPAEGEVDEAQAAEEEQRAIERHQQLTLHQALGLSSLVAMGGTFALGKLYVNGSVPQAAHVAAAGLATGLYLTTASLAIFAPAPALTRQSPPGWDSVSVHRAMAWVHGAGMASTVGLGLSSVLGGPMNPSLHGWLGLGTTVLMTLSAGGILLAP